MLCFFSLPSAPSRESSTSDSTEAYSLVPCTTLAKLGAVGSNEKRRKGRNRARPLFPVLVPLLLLLELTCLLFSGSLQIAALQVIERGLVSLDTDVGTILPGLAQPRILTGYSEGGEPQFVDAKNKVTLRHLLNHSSGLSLAWFSRGEINDQTSFVREGGLDRRADLDLTFGIFLFLSSRSASIRRRPR